MITSKLPAEQYITAEAGFSPQFIDHLTKKNNPPEEKVVEVNEGHMHEILDRVHCMNLMFNELIATHPAATLMPAEIEAVQQAISALYQKAGAISFEE